MLSGNVGFSTPELEEWVRQRNLAYSGSLIDSPDQADQSQMLTYVDIDTFRETSQSIPAARSVPFFPAATGGIRRRRHGSPRHQLHDPGVQILQHLRHQVIAARVLADVE